jgi:hypothetical protein
VIQGVGQQVGFREGDGLERCGGSSNDASDDAGRGGRGERVRGVSGGGTGSGGESGRVIDCRKGEEEGGARKGQGVRGGGWSDESSNMSTMISTNKVAYSATDASHGRRN